MLADWTRRAAWMLRPLHERLMERLKASEKLFADGTTAPVPDPGRGRTNTRQPWAYARDDRPWNGPDPPGAAYIYAPDRKAERSLTSPASRACCRWTGGGLPRPGGQGPSAAGLCWSHVRRRFYELAAAGLAPIASEALKRIGELYAVETEIRGRSAEERRAVRQDRSRPVIDALEPWLRAKLETISQKGKLPEAIRYALSRWEGHARFTGAGRIELDSNAVERAIRPLPSTARTASSLDQTAAENTGRCSLRSSRPAS